MPNLKLKSIADELLLRETKRLVREEREILTEILHHLREIERRRLFSSLQYGSLFAYATKELGYSEDQAYRRIQAMRLLKEIPEIEEKINQGTLNLTHLGMAQSLFKKEEKIYGNSYSKDEKIGVLEKLQNTSKREAEKITLSLSSEETRVIADKVRSVSAEHVEIKFQAKRELLEKLTKLKNLLSHKSPHLQLSELIDSLCDLGLEKWNRNSAPAKVTERHSKSQSQNENENQNQNNTLSQSYTQGRWQGQPQKPELSRAQIRCEIWRRDQGRCQICKSEYALEVDHIWPKSIGGEESLENLRLLCRSCNQRAAINIFGLKKMEKYLEN